ncbi:hypothetical protein T310_7508 [Rasamsonia emersonii CBS 393.64]|uniref:TAM domain methyltransferase n=1 Tax=Rasamsonia emersonii (strain ATCC 16479 / CBS 393.64 / IMI 116815) TaxID=1408163 RepID=A0A0F4YKY9_RASE3|nr:hypothetical protein T310_7508 [Rasamsonia emersonii CBS 393.64]KKA18536.1 hypothetical protein T310_7508 [Rasamsonia emersonii CBS 393.64]
MAEEPSLQAEGRAHDDYDQPVAVEDEEEEREEEEAEVDGEEEEEEEEEEGEEETSELSDIDSTSVSESESDDDGAHSISENLIKGVFENGRRYCNDTYFMPNDEAEQTRLNIVHQIFLILLDGELTKAPVPKGASRILDVGTGPGDWAIEMGELYPDAEIIATDISIFDGGPGRFGLPNVHFQLDDAEEEWTYHEPFDLIHMRGLSGAFRDWNAVYKQAFKHLKAGGYIEVSESDPAADITNIPNAPPNSYFSILMSAMRNTADAAGFPRGRDHLRPSALTSVGFVDVRVHDITVPVGTWPQDPRQKTLGKMALIGLLEGLEARSLRQLTATGKWTADEVRDLCEKAKREIVAAEGMTVSVRFVTGRKPMSYAPYRIRHRRKMDQLFRELQLK